MQTKRFGEFVAQRACVLARNCKDLKWALFVGKFSEVEDSVEAEDYEELAKQLGNASPLEIMDKALEKFGNEIAIAFRYVFKFKISSLWL